MLCHVSLLVTTPRATNPSDTHTTLSLTHAYMHPHTAPSLTLGRRQAFEESQGKLDEELAVRTAKEIALREEAEAKRAAEEAERR